MVNPQTESEERSRGDGSIWIGVLISIACQVAMVVLPFVVASQIRMSRPDYTFMFVAAASGLTQWILVLPLVFYLKRKGKSRTVKGLLIMSFIGLGVYTLCSAGMLIA